MDIVSASLNLPDSDLKHQRLILSRFILQKGEQKKSIELKYDQGIIEKDGAKEWYGEKEWNGGKEWDGAKEWDKGKEWDGGKSETEKRERRRKE